MGQKLVNLMFSTVNTNNKACELTNNTAARASETERLIEGILKASTCGMNATKTNQENRSSSYRYSLFLTQALVNPAIRPMTTATSRIIDQQLVDDGSDEFGGASSNDEHGQNQDKDNQTSSFFG